MTSAETSAEAKALAARGPGRPGDTSEEVYVRLRDLIVEGEYAPGERPHARLMEALGVGRTPLRTALSRLQSDGLVIATPNRGVEVAEAPVSSAEEIYALRFLVEPPLLEASAPTISAEHLAQMRHWLTRMERAGRATRRCSPSRTGSSTSWSGPRPRRPSSTGWSWT